MSLGSWPLGVNQVGSAVGGVEWGGGRRRVGIRPRREYTTQPGQHQVSLKDLSPQTNLFGTIFKGYDHVLIYLLFAEELLQSQAWVGV